MSCEVARCGLTINDFLSLDFLWPKTCQDVSPHQLLPVWRIMLRVCSLVIFTLDISSTHPLEPGTRLEVSFLFPDTNPALKSWIYIGFNGFILNFDIIMLIHLLIDFGVPSWVLEDKKQKKSCLK